MKFSHRVSLTLFLGVVVFGSMTYVVRRSEQLRHHRRASHALDLSAIRRSAAAAGSDEIPSLLDRVLDQMRSGAADPRDAWDRLLRNRSASDAWIKLARLLEQRGGHVGREIQLNIERAGQSFRYHGNENGIGQSRMNLNRSEIETLTRILYKTFDFSNAERKANKFSDKLPGFAKMYPSRDRTSYERFVAAIRRHSLYTDFGIVDELLRDLARQPITASSQMSGGTQIKLLFRLADRSQAVFKPRRFSRDKETLPDHFYFCDFERHTAEIAAFHLDRILDFRRVPPVTGRVVNITRDIWRLVDDRKFQKTVFVSPAGNLCFHGNCDYYCDTGHAICGQPELLEGSMAIYLSTSHVSPRKRWRHPWRRSYSKHKKAKWETQSGYCDEVKATPPYNDTKRLLDIMDMATFDFLTGNMDRHHYETFSDFGNNTFTLLLDNGRGFGRSGYDELSILAPVYQCCLFRASTLYRLLVLHTGNATLGALMERSLANDPLPGVLSQRHLAALDRRVEKILVVISRCLAENESRHVIVDDGF